MKNNIIMLVLSLIVAGAMVVTLLWFFKRLKTIEQNRRGKKQ